MRKVKSGWDQIVTDSDERPIRQRPARRPRRRSQRALELSQRAARQLADTGEAERVISLDAERLRLIKSARHALTPMTDEDRAVLREIADLNARSLGRMEHRLRAKCRDMDMLAAGRRALRAYSQSPALSRRALPMPSFLGDGLIFEELLPLRLAAGADSRRVWRSRA